MILLLKPAVFIVRVKYYCCREINKVRIVLHAKKYNIAGVNPGKQMQYLSPFTLLEGITPELVDRKSIALGKKKMLAELELEGGTSIIVEGREFTRDGIIVFFDELLQEDNISYHVAITKDVVLQRFITHNILENGDRFTNTSLLGNPAFIQWISPYYYTAFTNFAAACLNDMADNGWTTLLANPRLMTPVDEENAWVAIEELIYRQMDTLADFDRGENNRMDSINALVSFAYINMLRQLPEERFAVLRDQYAWLVMQCAIIIFNRYSRNEGRIGIENALLLAVSGHIREGIAKTQAEMEGLLQQKKEHKFSPWAGISIAFIVIKLIVSVASNNNNNNFHFENAPIYYTMPGGNERQLVNPDSLQEQIRQMNEQVSRARRQAGMDTPLDPVKQQQAFFDSILRKHRQMDSLRAKQTYWP